VSDFTVNEDAGTAEFVISYTGNTVQDAFNVNFNVTDNTAISPDDYNVANTDAFVTFPVGTLSGDTQLVTINIVDDMLIEATETLDITLAFDATPPVGINMLDDAAVGTITDNDANGPTEGIAVSDFTVNEDAGTAEFVISYTGNTVQDTFNVNFNVTDNTAISPDDYNVANTDAFVTFPAGTLSGVTQLVTINIVDDMLIEATETLDIALAFDAVPPAGINMLDDAAVGTITDNDANGPTEGVAVADFTVNEDAGTAEFVISYTGNTVQDTFNVNFNVTDNTAISPDDYTVANTDTFVTFPAGTLSGDTQLVTINIVDDMLIEATETLDIALTFDAVPPAGINMLDDAAVGTITDNDANGPTEGIAVSDFTVNEDAGTAEFVISYTGNTVRDAFNVNFNVTDNTAINPDDYTVANTDTFVTFPAGTASGSFLVVTINIVDDMLIEANETLDIALAFDATPPAGINMLDGNGVGTITDNDANGPTEGIAVSDFTVNEDAGTETLDIALAFDAVPPAGINMLDDAAVGTITDNDANGPTEGIAVSDFTVNEDAGTAEFVISYTGNTVQDAFNVNFNVTDNTAINPDDYNVVAVSGALVFPAGTVDGDAQTITVSIIDDELNEMAETLDITLAFDVPAPAGINMLDDAAVGTITDNDANGPTEGIAVSDFTVNEDAGTAEFVISYTGNTVQDTFNVNFNVTDNTAISPDDYTVANTDTFVTFPAGTLSGDTQLVTINIVDDMLIEATETLDIALAFDAVPPAGINMLDDAAVGTITDNDANGPTEGIVVSDFTVNEDAGTAEFVISYTGNTVQDAFNVNFNVTDNTAINPDDYTVANTDAFVTFPAGTLSGDTQLVTINIVDDMLIEATETLDIALAFDAVPPAGINMLDGEGIGTILDNDISASPYEEEVIIICGDELPEVPELTFMGGCGDYDVVFNEETEFSDDTDDYMVIRTWVVTDSCGNTESFQQIVFVMQPQLQEVFIDICVEDDPINLIDYLPEGFDINGTFETELDDVYLNNTTFVPYGLEIGEYKIMYSSTGGTCKYYVDFYITTNKDCVPCNRDEIKVSKTVTVNGDGVNDYFEIKGVEYCEFTYDVMIFNRWGDKVYEGKDYKNDWGGIAPSNSVGNSGLVPTGTYYYIISINGSEQPLEPINGYIYVGTK
ncbi:Calx-beta domain-containing protein, partial [Maribacter sp. 4U21]|uniref:Calx-beta domain-containing protein n=1 Tax=Maribacter sp. 4U21 TaxID=1889779 RepID=UPI0015D4E37F